MSPGHCARGTSLCEPDKHIRGHVTLREGWRASGARGRGKARCEHTVCGCWPHWCGGRCRCGARRRDRRAWLRCRWAVAGPGQASRRCTEPCISDQAPLVWRAPEGPEGLAAVPVGGGGAWPGFETTRRAKLAARTARGRAAAHGHAKQPGPAGGRGLRQRPEHQRPPL